MAVIAERLQHIIGQRTPALAQNFLQRRVMVDHVRGNNFSVCPAAPTERLFCPVAPAGFSPSSRAIKRALCGCLALLELLEGLARSLLGNVRMREAVPRLPNKDRAAVFSALGKGALRHRLIRIKNSYLIGHVFSVCPDSRQI